MNFDTGFPPGKARNLSLDGLRGASCVGIVFYHGFYTEYFYWLWTLVDLFFVLSGFLISRLIVRGLKHRNFSLWNFMIRRGLRVWPVYYLTLLVCFKPVIFQFFGAGEWDDDKGMFRSLFFLQFTDYYFEKGMVGSLQNFIPSFQHSWSLAVEEQFYLLLPIILVFLRNKLGALVFFLVCCIAGSVYFRYEGASYYILISRMDGLAIGVLLGIYWVYIEEAGKFPQLQIKSTMAACCGGFALLLVGFYFMTPLLNKSISWDLSVWRNTIGLLGFNLFYGCLILTLSKDWVPWLTKLMSCRVFVGFGGISFALYMFHLPIGWKLLSLEGVRYISDASIGTQLTYFVLPIILATISKKLIEDPFLKLKRFFPLYRTEPIAPFRLRFIVS